MKYFFSVALLIGLASPIIFGQSPQNQGKPQSRSHKLQHSKHKAKPSASSAPTASGIKAVTTSSGLTYLITHRGNGRKPKAGETVLVHYTGTLIDGKKFDSSHDRHEPLAFSLGIKQVIQGWDEGIALLGIGDQAILIIPPALGYGEKGAGNVIPPNSTLVFFVELVDIRGASVSGLLSKTLSEKGLEAALKQFSELKAGNFADVVMNESELNGLGYRLMRQKKFKEALEFLKLNVEMYPQSANVYDSLGEAYLQIGDKNQAITNYRKSLQLDPNNTNALEVLKKLETTDSPQ